MGIVGFKLPTVVRHDVYFVVVFSPEVVAFLFHDAVAEVGVTVEQIAAFGVGSAEVVECAE